MQTYFTWWNVPFKFLFESWTISTALAMVFTALSVFAVAFFYESIKVLVNTLQKSFFALPLVVASSSAADDSFVDSIHITDSYNHVRNQRIKSHCLQTAIHVIRVAIGYGLMLAIMTYNGYIALALLIGAALGYFFFCSKIDKILLPSNTSSTAVSTMTSQSNIDAADSALQPLTERETVA